MAQTNTTLGNVVKLTQAQYNTLAGGGTVGTETGLQEGKIYLVENQFGDTRHVNSYGVNTRVTSNGTTRYISFICSADIDYGSSMLRMRISIWSTDSGTLSESTTRFMKVTSLFAFVGMGSDYTIDVDAFSGSFPDGEARLLGTWVRTNPVGTTSLPASLFHGYCPYSYYWPSTNYVYFARGENMSSPSTISDCAMKDLVGGQGITADLAIPFKEF